MTLGTEAERNGTTLLFPLTPRFTKSPAMHGSESLMVMLQEPLSHLGMKPGGLMQRKCFTHFHALHRFVSVTSAGAQGLLLDLCWCSDDSGMLEFELGLAYRRATPDSTQMNS